MTIREAMDRWIQSSISGTGQFISTLRPDSIPVDVLEQDAAFEVRASVPGVKPEDVEVTVENNVLTLKGEKKLPTDVKEEQFRRVERDYGTFSRSFTLPNFVDAGKVTAEFKNGVLTVKLPYREEAKPRTINVEVAA